MAKSKPIEDLTKRKVDQDGESGIGIGEWFWVKEPKYDAWLGCVIHIGSNYVKLRGPSDNYRSSYSTRVHFSDFHSMCTLEPDAERLIGAEIEKHRQAACLLMEKVQDITRKLAISPRPSLNDGSETQALVLHSSTQPVEDYKKALIKAQEKTLPDLFKQIKKENEAMGNWMQAPLIAMEAELEGLEPAIHAIKDRIFNVELYAGLIEQVVQIAEGEPADLSEPIHLFQRRAYMDEECLAEYETGGMSFKDIKAFDKWLTKPRHRNRLLPFPRCVLAFRVRRHDKERDAISIRDFINIAFANEEDKTTFLYIRNGDQIFRLNTGIEFDEQLFPDMERSNLDGVVYAKMFANRVDGLIGEGEYLEMVASEKKEEREYKRKEAELRRRKVPKNKWFMEIGSGYIHRRSDDYRLWTPDDVYYDDIAGYVKKQIDAHNRLVLVLQGLLDRSPVFHPHPPWQLWSGDSFEQAIRLIYDDSRALVAGDKPDFEAYRARLNASLKVGSITVGQDDYWQHVEADRYNAACHRNWRIRDHRDVTRYSPYGNPGPGMLAVVQKLSGKGCTYRWTRGRSAYRRYYSDDTPIACTLTVPRSKLLNVDAYQPGDLKQFYSDPRTRAEYLTWACLLLETEEYHAGNRKLKRER